MRFQSFVLPETSQIQIKYILNQPLCNIAFFGLKMTLRSTSQVLILGTNPEITNIFIAIQFSIRVELKYAMISNQNFLISTILEDKRSGVGTLLLFRKTEHILALRLLILHELGFWFHSYNSVECHFEWMANLLPNCQSQGQGVAQAFQHQWKAENEKKLLLLVTTSGFKIHTCLGLGNLQRVDPLYRSLHSAGIAGFYYCSLPNCFSSEPQVVSGN